MTESSQYLPRHVYSLVPVNGQVSRDEGTDYVSGTDPDTAGGKDCVLLFEALTMATAAAQQFAKETRQSAEPRIVDVASLGDYGEIVMLTLYRASGDMMTLSAADYRARIDPDSFDYDDLT